MATTFAALGLAQLTAREKLNVVGDLWDDLAQSSSPGDLLSDAQRVELEKRIDDAIRNPDDWVTWEDALASTLQRISK